MFTTRTTNVPRPNTRTLAIAAALAGSAALVGAVAVGASGSATETAPSTDANVIDTADSDESIVSPVDQPAPALVDASTADEPTPTPSPADSDDHPVSDSSGETPADEPTDPEQPAPGLPGVIEGESAGNPPPPPPPTPTPSALISVPKPPPPLPSIPSPVDLVTPPMDPGPPPIDDFVSPVDPTPFDGPTDFKVTPVPGHLGTITSGFSGCQLECVTSALLSANHVNADMTLDVNTTVPVHFEVEVNEVGGDWGEHFNNSGYAEQWSTTLGPLAPDTTYDLTLIAIDTDGFSKMYDHRFTTADIVDGFASNHTGCALECITSGSVQIDGDPNDVEVQVVTNTPAALQVWVSTGAPTWVDDPDAKPLPETLVYSNENPSTSWTFDVNGLDFDTEYHVVARAFDDHGEHYRVGTFQTGADPSIGVLVTFEEINLTYDGDKGKLNRGEVAFGWGFDDGLLGYRSEEKMHARTIDLGSNNARWFAVDADGGSIPNPIMVATERDADGLVEFCAAGVGLSTSSHYIADCDTKTNTAHFGGSITLADIESFPTCAEFGVEAGIGTRCAALGSAVFGTRDDDYAHFSVIVSFWVAD